MFIIFRKSFVALILYETVEFCFSDGFGRRFLLRSYGFVSLVNFAA